MIEITNISMKVNADEEEVKAYASIILNNSVKINGIKLLTTREGKLYVLLPESRERPIQYVGPINAECRRYIDETLIDRYLTMREAFINKNPPLLNEDRSG